jgi:hypothetical protein
MSVAKCAAREAQEDVVEVRPVDFEALNLDSGGAEAA